MFLACVLAFGYYLYSNMQANLAKQNVSTGFSYLGREAGFGIGESWIAYSPAASYARALLVGFVNTIAVAVVGVVLATLIGISIGIASLSKNWLVAPDHRRLHQLPAQHSSPPPDHPLAHPDHERTVPADPARLSGRKRTLSHPGQSLPDPARHLLPRVRGAYWMGRRAGRLDHRRCRGLDDCALGCSPHGCDG